MENPWVHCLLFQLDNMLELIWVLLMVLLMLIEMACLRDKHWQYHLDLLMVKHLARMKASYLDLIFVKCLGLHLELLMDLILVILMAPLMVPMMANQWVHCLVIHLDKMMDVS